MAAIDSLLRVMVLRDAQAMTLAAGQSPALRRAGQPEPLAMPALDAAMVASFVTEVVPGEMRADLDARGSADVVYRASDGVQFGVLVERLGDGHRLIVRRHSGAKPATAVATAPGSSTVAPAVVAAVAPSARVHELHVVDRGDDGANRDDRDDDRDRAGGGAAAVLPPRIARWLDEASAREASDLLLSVGRAPRLRIAGEAIEIAEDDQDVGADELLGLLDRDARRTLAARGAVDLAMTTPSGRIRVNVFQHLGGVGASLRLIRERVPSTKDLRLPDDLVAAVAHRSGLVLIAGQAGSGKSTTLVALVEHVNRTRAAHVITLEDPIEYAYTARKSLIHQREIGVHAPTFADGLRAALRESPDVIVVGELRDRETIAIALTAAETGHLVLGTLHAPNAAGAIDRIIDIFPEQQQRQARVQLASTLRVIITQFLVPARGVGRVPAIERVNLNAAVASLIRRNELHLIGSHIQTGRDTGMIPLERSLAGLVQSGVVDVGTARGVAQDQDLFEQLLRAPR